MCNETLWCIHVTTVAVQHNSALFFLCVAEIQVTVNYTRTLTVAQHLLWAIYVTGKNTTYVGLHVKCLMLH
jgi:hypothetical protein